MGTVNNRRTRMSTDGKAIRTRTYNCCAAPTSTSGGRTKGNISGGEITRNGKRSAKMTTFLMPLRLASVVDRRRSRLLSIVNRPKTQQSLLPFDTETKFLGYLNRWYATGTSREKPLLYTSQSCRAHIKVLHVLFVYCSLVSRIKGQMP